MTRTTWHRCARGALAVAAIATVLCGPFATPRPAAARTGCLDGVLSVERWLALPQPKTPLVSVDQVDGDPCTLIGTGIAGQAWHSSDGGLHWTAADPGARMLSVHTEGLALALGTGIPLDAYQTVYQETPRLLVSHDLRTFAPAEVGVRYEASQLPYPFGGPTPAPVGATVTDGWGDVVAAQSTRHIEGGRARTDVYAVARPSRETMSAAGTAANVLLKSVDGGASFAPAQGAVQLSPTAVAVNPTTTDEIWVNDLRDGGSGGAYVSDDGGKSFQRICCDNSPRPGAVVSDITLTPIAGGYAQVLVATDQGVMGTIDGGTTWTRLTTEPAVGVRTAPDDAATVVVATATGVVMASGKGTAFRPMAGLPKNCRPSGLRRAATVPAVFLLDCGPAQQMRLVLAHYGTHVLQGGNGSTPPIDGWGGLIFRGRPLAELARWSLPDANPDSAGIAFGGTSIYYDRKTRGDIGEVSASDGRFLGILHLGIPVLSMSFDLRRDRLIVTTTDYDMYAYDVRSRALTRLGSMLYKVPSYDPSFDGFSWVVENEHTLYNAPLTGGPALTKARCDFPGNDVSTYVAGGDGGGYVQLEDDRTVLRIDGTCRITGVFEHRSFAESSLENDAMACDAQTFFPQPAVWIRDSGPQTVSAYGLPLGYCPMPSDLTLAAPALVYQGTTAQVCTRLTNATTGAPAAGRPTVVSAADVVLGRALTDAAGGICVPYVAPPSVAGRRPVALVAAFAGDSSLYPARATGLLTLVGGAPLMPPPVPAAGLPVPPPPLPPVPPQPLAEPGPLPAPGAVAAPNPAPAPQGQPMAQAQPIVQGVVVPQRQEQPQLVFARAANALQEDYAMSALPARDDGPSPAVPLAAVAITASLGCAWCAARRPAYARVGRRS